MVQNGPHIDSLITGQIKSPLLDEYYKSPELKAEVVAVATEVKRRYLAALAPHNDTGNLARTAKVTTHRSQVHPDRRWEAEFSVGGGRADYADDLEREYHLLAGVLTDMGFYQGTAASGPTGRIAPEKRAPKSMKASRPQAEVDAGAAADRFLRSRIGSKSHNDQKARLEAMDDPNGVIKNALGIVRLRAQANEERDARKAGSVTLYHRTASSEAAQSIARGGFKPTFPEGTNEGYARENSQYGYFTKDPDAQAGYGRHLLSVEVPASAVEEDPWSGHQRVRVENLPADGFKIENGDD